MSALTLRIADDKHQRLRLLARSRGSSINKLLDELTSLMLTEFDAETQFKLRAHRGSGASKKDRGLALLQKARG
jgi:hypothetical protein